MTDTNQALCETETVCEPNRTVFRPAADIVETAGGFEVVVDLPGAREEDIDVTIERDVLSIRGSVSPAENGEFEEIHSEFRVGDYFRRFTLPDNLDRDSIDASLKDGVLTLKFSRVAEAGPKKVAVRSA